MEIDRPGRGPRVLGHTDVSVRGAGRPVPHLHRMVPGRPWLSTLDGAARRLVLTTLKRSADAPARRELAVEIPDDELAELRWLEDGSGFAVASGSNVWVAQIELDAPPARITPTAVFAPTQDIGEVLDVQTIPDGFFVITRARHHRRAHVVRVSGRTVHASPVQIPSAVVNATVDAHGSVLARIIDGDRNTIIRIDPTADPPRVERLPCPVPGGDCSVVNWVPGAHRPIYATAAGYVVIGDRPMIRTRELAAHERLRSALRGPPRKSLPAGPATTHSLWATDDERRVLAANGSSVMLWDESGTLVWEWSSSNTRATFAPDGSVLVAAGLEVYRLRKGRATRIKTIPRQRAASDDLDPVFLETHVAMHSIDQLLALPGGGFAYSLVESYRPLSDRELRWRKPN